MNIGWKPLPMPSGAPLKRSWGGTPKCPSPCFMAKPPLVIRLRPKRDMPIYDLTLHDGAMVIPAPVTGEFIGPNGASMRPNSVNLHDLLATRPMNARVGILPAGYELPEKLVLLHEFHDHYSLQTTEKCTLKDLNERMSKLFRSLESITTAEFFQRYPTFDE